MCNFLIFANNQFRRLYVKLFFTSIHAYKNFLGARVIVSNYKIEMM